MAQSTPEVRAERRRLRALRRALRGPARLEAERAIDAALGQLGVFRRGARVAVYLAMPGEVRLRSCFEEAARRGVRLYVPRIVNRRAGRMVFVPWTHGRASRRNAFGIAEPEALGGSIPALGLDTVVVPVVGFDRRGHRLGMGAGYYDRALRRRLTADRAWRRPRLVGVAFSIQEVPRIEPSPWDVSLDLVVTERGIVAPDRGLPGGRTT
ncbi:MAG: 5-formyltetrahydrofolate cyclo-ligase [Lysobacterales bacterium]|nr:MAG: 5-formyltetrahydrofolate cyclo-ligase [Xanthomonadales bacterium]